MVRHQAARDGSVPPSGRRRSRATRRRGHSGRGRRSARSHRRACGRSMEVAAAPVAQSRRNGSTGDASSGGDRCVRSRRASGRARALRALPPPLTPSARHRRGLSRECAARAGARVGDRLTPSGTAVGLCRRARATRALTSTHQPACVGAHARHMRLLRSDATSAAATAAAAAAAIAGQRAAARERERRERAAEAARQASAARGAARAVRRGAQGAHARPSALTRARACGSPRARAR